jgi:hypothetical protein
VLLEQQDLQEQMELTVQMDWTVRRFSMEQQILQAKE